jgi:hypothetical protein
VKWGRGRGIRIAVIADIAGIGNPTPEMLWDDSM